MRIAVIGSGGREHAIAWKLAQSIDKNKIFCLPGNGGTWNNVPVKADDFAGIEKFCNQNKVELIVVGPEVPLAKGIADYFAESDIRVFGPSKDAARLESSKIWAKKFMKKYGVATADFWMLEDGDDIEQVIDETDGNVVVKYDGLAAGKGVFVCGNRQEAYDALEELKNRYGETAPFFIEQKFSGQELSIIGFTDGKNFRLLQPSQDHKPAFDGDKGPNTGGMGAYCPVPVCNEDLLKQIQEAIVLPTLRGIQNEQLNYHGVIYFGLMLTEEGPKLLEYNVRFGDPETEVILPALKTDLLTLIRASLDETLDRVAVEFNDGYFVDVVLASGGYPGSYEKGKVITGLDDVSEDTLLFHAGTEREGNRIVTSGGRVLNVVARADTLAEAIDKAYREAAKISFENMYYRKDIGKKGLTS
ncbi:MAG: phosphoribosylamine--glycine ligase [Calditrichaeota bacterium]|nr:phosphoribosylamine--glycine ligase [Calditrichota bacterium]